MRFAISVESSVVTSVFVRICKALSPTLSSYSKILVIRKFTLVLEAYRHHFLLREI